jgi:DNA-binding HxlR family transcriptional regulator
MPIALNTCVKNYPAVYRNPEILCEGRHAIIDSNGPLSNPTPAVRPSPREPLFVPRSGRSGARLGEKWSMLVVMLLRDGPRRFNDIKRNTGGISQQMLTRSLRGLERDGMLTRTIHPTSPPQVEYQLSEMGLSLSEPAFGQ